MIIKNRFLRFSSLCIVGAVTIIANQIIPANASQGDTEDVSEIYDIAGEDSNEVYSGEKLVGIEDGTLSEVDLDAAKDKSEKAKIDTAIPDIPGLTGKSIDLSKYDGLAIANVDNYLNVRKKAGKNAALVGSLPAKAGCYIIGKETVSGELWYKIKSGNIQGYVLAKYLITGNKALSMIVKVGRYVTKVKCETLNVREKASTDADVLYTIAEGEELDIVGIKDGWVEVSTDFGEQTAFVSDEYVTVTFELKTAVSLSESSMIGYSSSRTAVEKNCHQYIGLRYISGGTSLSTGADCSGFVQSLYKKYAGISLPRTAAEQSSCGKSVTESQLRPGDLVFYYNSNKHVTHVAIYIGKVDGKAKIIHASNPSDGVKYSNMAYSANRFYRNVLGD